MDGLMITMQTPLHFK